MNAPTDTPEATSMPRADQADVVVPVLEEQLRVSHRWIETGHAMRVRKLVREHTRDVELPAWREQVLVERVPVDRVIDAPVAVHHEGEVLVIPVVEERLVMRTERVLREEVRITRRRVAEPRVEPVTLRHEVAIVERFDPAAAAWIEVPIETSAAAAGATVPQAEAPSQAPVAGPNSTPPRPRIPIMYTVIGAFEDRSTAQRAVDLLATRGFSRDAIDLQARPDTLDPTASTTSTSIDRDAERRGGEDDGFFAGVRHFFASLFGSDDEQQIGIYSEAIRRGSTLVVVDARDQAEADRAAEAMREQGGTIDLDERSTAWRAEGWGADAPHAATGGTAGAMAAQALADGDRKAPTAPRNRDRSHDTLTDEERRRLAGSAEGDVVMPVVQEEVKIGKRPVEQGGVRVVRRVSETPVSELVRLRQERARIDRRPADRAATPADLENFREGSVEVRERSEEPVVEKVARVVEEVVVGKEVDERTERVEDKVRRTDVEIDRLSRKADDALGRATGDAYDEDDALARTPNTTPPRTGERGRTPTPPETRRKT
jgi:uncharacterized protein (TIGR02271 family)